MTFRAPFHETNLSDGVCIVAPKPKAYRTTVERLQASLERVVGPGVEILGEAGEGIRGRHAVVLGNMMDSGFMRSMYFRGYDWTDLAWPGPGGWALRTIPHSLSGVGHVIAMSVSEAKDAPEAAEALAGALAGPVVPFQYRVKLGRWADLFSGPARETLAKGDADLEREFTAGPGDWTYMWAIADIGVLAVQTGDEDLMRMFCRQVCHFARTRWFERHLPDPPQIHGFLRTMLLPFTHLENHPTLPRDLREETLSAFLGIYRSTEGAGNPGFLRYVGLDQVRQNHQTMSAMDLFHGGRYFHQAHGLAEGLAWMKLAEVFYAPQMTSSKPVCDSWGHQWAFSLLNTADFALASGRMDYFRSRPFLEAADRALIAHSHLEEGPLQYFLVAAAATGNTEYLQLCRVSDADNLVRRALRQKVEPLRAWVTGRRASAPKRLGRVGAAPLSRLFYDSLEGWGSFAPEGTYQRDVSYEKTFDKVFFRSGWTKEDDYLLLCGISGGSHSYQDGNCIVRYTSRGKSWFGGRIGLGVASVRDHVGVSVAVDGEGPGCEARYASLEYLKEGNRLSVSGTAMNYPGLADWHRHIVHSEDGWFLVVDEVKALKRGEFLVEARWHVLGEVSLSDGELRSVQGDACLTMEHSGSGRQELSPVRTESARGGTRWTQRSLVRLARGSVIRFATLFGAHRAGKPRDFSMEETDAVYRVKGSRGSVAISLTRGKRPPEVSATRVVLPAAGRASGSAGPQPFEIVRKDLEPVWSATCGEPVRALGVGEGRTYAGGEGGSVTALDAGGGVLWRTGLTGSIRAIEAMSDGVVAGGDQERVTQLDLDGREIWSHQLHWQPMNWDYWTLKNCIVLSLTAGDLDGDGRTEILAGCADRHVYAFDDGGRLLWRAACQWGPPACLGLARLKEGEELQVLAGMADPSIHGCVRVYDTMGECIGTLSRPDLMCWGIPSWMKCLRVADLDGDGWSEVITGVDTNHRQLIVYRRDGKILWEADLGGAVTCVEAEAGRVYAGASNGFVQCFSRNGGRIWSRFLVEPVVGIAPVARSRCLVALRGGRVVVLDGVGAIKDAGDGGAIAAAAWAKREGLAIGRTDGTVGLYA